jgi:hypothetical protein
MPSLARLLFIAAVAVFVAGRPLPHGTEPSPKQPSSAQKGRPSGASPKQPSSPQNGKPSVASANQPDKDHGKGGDIVDDMYVLHILEETVVD